MQTWPPSLQHLLNIDAFNYEFGDTIVRSDMDIGPAKVRSRYTDGVDRITCTINMELDDYLTLKDFYKTTLSNGSLTFAYNHPITQVPVEMRFATPPTMSPMGGRWFKVSMQWEIMP